MKSIRVNKSKLLDILKHNRAEHHDIFLEAQQGYKRALITEFEKRLDIARKGKKVDTYINLVAPIDQTKDYDRAIGMLELSLDTELDLTEQDYANYVLDDWTWKHNFLASNSYYSAKAAATIAAESE